MVKRRFQKSLLIVPALLALGACGAQKPPTLAEARHAFHRFNATNTNTTSGVAAVSYISGDVARTMTFSPKTIADLKNCTPAKNQKGNVCEFSVIGDLAIKYNPMALSNFAFKNIRIVSTGRFYHDKNGTWFLPYVTPKQLVIPNRSCTGVSKCVVSYPAPTIADAQKYITSVLNKFGYTVGYGGGSTFFPKKIDQWACAPTMFHYACTAKIEGTLKTVPEGFFFGKPPATRFSKQTVVQRLNYRRIFRNDAFLGDNGTNIPANGFTFYDIVHSDGF